MSTDITQAPGQNTSEDEHAAFQQQMQAQTQQQAPNNPAASAAASAAWLQANHPTWNQNAGSASEAASINAAYRNNTLPILPTLGTPSGVGSQAQVLHYNPDGSTTYISAAQDAANEAAKHAAAFDPINYGNFANVPLSQIASQYGVNFADMVQGHFTENPTQNFLDINQQYNLQQNRVTSVGTAGTSVFQNGVGWTEAGYTGNNSGGTGAAQIALEVGRTGATDTLLNYKALAEGADPSKVIFATTSYLNRPTFQQEMLTTQEGQHFVNNAWIGTPIRQNVLAADIISGAFTGHLETGIHTAQGDWGGLYTPAPGKSASGNAPLSISNNDMISGSNTVAGFNVAGVDINVPYGDVVKEHIANTKDLINYNTGELAIYGYNPQSNTWDLIGGGGRNALQSGMFTVGSIAESKYVVERGNVGNYVMPSTVGLSRSGSEAYGGWGGIPLDNRTLTYSGALVPMGRYADAGNLANYVNPFGPNMGRGEAPSSAIPWSISPNAPSIQYMNENGVIPGAVNVPGVTNPVEAITGTWSTISYPAQVGITDVYNGQTPLGILAGLSAQLFGGSTQRSVTVGSVGTTTSTVPNAMGGNTTTTWTNTTGPTITSNINTGSSTSSSTPPIGNVWRPSDLALWGIQNNPFGLGKAIANFSDAILGGEYWKTTPTGTIKTSSSTVIPGYSVTAVTPNAVGGMNYNTTTVGNTVTNTANSQTNYKTVVTPVEGTLWSSLKQGYESITNPYLYQNVLGSVGDTLAIKTGTLEQHPMSEIRNLQIDEIVNLPKITGAVFSPFTAGISSTIGNAISNKVNDIFSPYYDTKSEAHTKAIMETLPSEAVKTYFAPIGTSVPIWRDGVYKGEYQAPGSTLRFNIDPTAPLNFFQTSGSLAGGHGGTGVNPLSFSPIGIQTDTQYLAQEKEQKANPNLLITDIIPTKMEGGAFTEHLWNMPIKDPVGAAMYYGTPWGLGWAEEGTAYLALNNTGLVGSAAGFVVENPIARTALQVGGVALMTTMVTDTLLRVPGYKFDPLGATIGFVTGSTKDEPLIGNYKTTGSLIGRAVDHYDENGNPVLVSQSSQATGGRGGTAFAEVGLMYLGGLANSETQYKYVHDLPAMAPTFFEQVGGKLADVFNIAFEPGGVGNTEAIAILRSPVKQSGLGNIDLVPESMRDPANLMPDVHIRNIHGEVVTEAMQESTGIPSKENPELTARGLSAAVRDKYQQIKTILQSGTRERPYLDQHSMDIGKNVANARSYIKTMQDDLTYRVNSGQITAEGARPLQRILDQNQNWLDDLMGRTITVRDPHTGNLVQQNIGTEVGNYITTSAAGDAHLPSVDFNIGVPTSVGLGERPFEVELLGSTAYGRMGSSNVGEGGIKELAKDVDVTAQNPAGVARNVADRFAAHAQEQLNSVGLPGIQATAEATFPTQWTEDLLGIHSNARGSISGQMNEHLTDLFGERDPTVFNVEPSFTNLGSQGIHANAFRLPELSNEELGIDLKAKSPMTPKSDTGATLPWLGFFRENPTDAKAPFEGLGSILFGNPNLVKIKTGEYTRIKVNPREPLTEIENLPSIMGGGRGGGGSSRSSAPPSGLLSYASGGGNPLSALNSIRNIGQMGIGNMQMPSGKSGASGRGSSLPVPRIELPPGFGRYPTSATARGGASGRGAPSSRSPVDDLIARASGIVSSRGSSFTDIIGRSGSSSRSPSGSSSSILGMSSPSSSSKSSISSLLSSMSSSSLLSSSSSPSSSSSSRSPSSSSSSPSSSSSSGSSSSLSSLLSSSFSSPSSSSSSKSTSSSRSSSSSSSSTSTSTTTTTTTGGGSLSGGLGSGGSSGGGYGGLLGTHKRNYGNPVIDIDYLSGMFASPSGTGRAPTKKGSSAPVRLLTGQLRSSAKHQPKKGKK